MGGGLSKTENVATMISRDITEMHTETIQSTFAKTETSQDMNIKIGACTVKGASFSQKSTFKLDVKALQEAATENKLDSATKNKLKQKAESVKESISLRTGADYTRNISDSLAEAYTDIYTKTRQDCYLDLTNKQTMNLEISGEGCNVEDVPFTQEILTEAVLSCTQKAVTDNDVVKKITQDLDQTASSEEKNTIAGVISSILEGLTGPIAIVAAVAGVVAIIAIVMYGGSIFGSSGGEKPESYQFQQYYQDPVEKQQCLQWCNRFHGTDTVDNCVDKHCNPAKAPSPMKSSSTWGATEGIMLGKEIRPRSNTQQW